VIESRESLLSQLGFRFGINGPHAARTMMLDDLRLLLSHTSPQATRSDYAAAVVEANVLGKPTRKARELAFRHLAALYALDASNPIFRALRRLWPLDDDAQPQLALAVALARDPLLRTTQTFVLTQPPGAVVGREAVESVIDAKDPNHFSAESLKAFAQRIGGTWTSAGYLQGKVRKIRVVPNSHPESVTLLLFLGYLEGRTGQRLFSSEWMALFGGAQDALEAVVNAASHRGLLVFMNAGGVKEVRFPGYLTPEEEQVRQEVSHVI
jgi:hypothetical protein